MPIKCGARLIAGLMFAAASTLADPVGAIDQIIAFGDSLSDSGNASIATLGLEPETQGPGYYYRSVAGVPFPVGEFTNAPTATGPTGVWLDQLAPKLGVPVAQPALAGGSNYAVADAVTGSVGTNNIDLQINAFNAATSGKAPSNVLYTIWGGANDILDKTNPVTAADNLYANIIKLSSEGARYFLWANLPNLGLTPAALDGPPGTSATATYASLAFDAEWALDLAKLQSDGISVVGVDVASLFAAIEANPSQYGFSNIDTPAILVPKSDADNYLFWDDVHPTAAADSLVADLAYADFVAAPEPTALGLAGFGLSALILTAFRRRRKQQANG